VDETESANSNMPQNDVVLDEPAIHASSEDYALKGSQQM
jgi:hypothetical protein